MLPTTLGTLLEEFNSYFKGSAEATIQGNVLVITIGSSTLRISMPEVIGGESTGPYIDPLRVDSTGPR